MPVENVGEIRPLLGQVTIQRSVTYHSDGTVAVQIAQELSLPKHFRLHRTTRLKWLTSLVNTPIWIDLHRPAFHFVNLYKRWPCVVFLRGLSGLDKRGACRKLIMKSVWWWHYALIATIDTASWSLVESCTKIIIFLCKYFLLLCY